MHMTSVRCSSLIGSSISAVIPDGAEMSHVFGGTAPLRVARRSSLRSTCQPTWAQAKRGPKKDRPKKQKNATAAPTAEPPQSAASMQPPTQSENRPLVDQPVRAADEGAITVGDRILPRIILFSGIPVLLGLLTLPGFYYLKVVKQIDVPTYVVYIASFLFFGTGLAGISYGIFSSSWDPSRSGSLSGLDEVKENVPVFLKKDNEKR